MRTAFCVGHVPPKQRPEDTASVKVCNELDRLVSRACKLFHAAVKATPADGDEAMDAYVAARRELRDAWEPYINPKVTP